MNSVSDSGQDGLSQEQHGKLDKASFPPLTHHDYAIGWICALPLEQTAAIAMLDAVHPALAKPSHDQNTYTLGRVGKHNIVIACLPKGQYATIPAAKVATWMMGTFTSIRFGLMVGIGAGMPSRVRLGDVVVSTPVGIHPGVVQWDLGKAEHGGGFVRTGVLNKPPSVFLTALTRLESQHSLKGSEICRFLDEARNRFPRLKSKYLPPEALDEIQTREPQVHCGLVASGNQVIKDAVVRDRLNEDLGGDFLCIEMEAAGLMNDFPCIVVRGICDYADAHKTKNWQDYAAAVAAACAKELLDFIDPRDVKQEREARQVVQTLREIASATEMIAQQQHLQIRTEKQRIEEEKWRKLSLWLSPIVPSVRHHENRKKRVEGTGSWLLEDSVFREWTSTPSWTLCCLGDPGAGKTIISSLVIDELETRTNEDPKSALGYVYCDFRDQQRQTPAAILGAIVRQLLKNLVGIPSAIWQIYEEFSVQRIELHLIEAQRLLHLVCAEFRHVYVCLDALDELGQLPSIMQLLQDRPSNIQLFLTFRPHIQAIVRRYLAETRDISVKAHENDIEKFINNEIGGPADVEPDAMDDELRMRIRRKICDSAKGNFLLPALQIRAVLQNLTIRERESSLKTLPSTLGEAFTGSFVRIQRQSKPLADRAARIIAWVYLASWPLGLDELMCALSIRAGDPKFDVKGIPVKRTLLNCCHGLVIVDDATSTTSTVRLVHYSLQEYLHRQSEIFGTPITEWHRHIAIICLTFARFPDRPDKKESQMEFEESQRESMKFRIHIAGALSDYAFLHWAYHLRNDKGTPDSVFLLIEESFSTSWGRYFWRALNMLLPDLVSEHVGPTSSGFMLSHIAAFFGLTEFVSYLNTAGVRFEERDWRRRTPLIWASRMGHTEVVRLLLTLADIDVSAIDDMERTSLHYAARQGHSDIVALLLAHPTTKPDVQDSNDDTPLMLAAKSGFIEPVRQLMTRPEVAVNRQGKLGLTALSRAAVAGQHEVVMLLLTYADIQVNLADHLGSTPLSLAARRDRVQTVRVLLWHPNIEANTRDSGGNTPLSWAVFGGFSGVIELLLAHAGIEVNPRDNDGDTPLLTAAQLDKREIVTSLLAHPEINVNIRDGSGRTPLLWMVVHGAYELVQSLLEQPQIELESHDRGKDPLLMAAKYGRSKIVKLLLAHPSVNTNARDEHDPSINGGGV